MKPRVRGEGKWLRTVVEHRAALAAFLRAAEAWPDETWLVPLGEGKWTPAQVTEHLALAYDALLAELGGGASMRPKVTGVRRVLLRWILLPHILARGTFPVRAVAPREIRPAAEASDRAEALARLRSLGERFEEELTAARARGGGRLTHPYFGSLPAAGVLRFAAVHLDHHRLRP